MTRNQKQKAIAQAAQNLADYLRTSTDRGEAFFGNQGVTVYRDGTYGDIIGYLLQEAGVLPKVTIDETDPAAAVALALGMTKSQLPESLQVSINTLAVAADDTKRSYARRIPKLLKLLDALATEIGWVILTSTRPQRPVMVDRQRFVVPGKQI